MTTTNPIAPNPLIGRLVAVAGTIVAIAIIVFGSTSIWPGQATITRHVLCDADHPDAFVVRSARDRAASASDSGPSVEFRMWCVSPSGVAHNVGWARPFGILAVGYAAVIWILLRIVRTRIRRRVRDAGGGPIITNAP